MDFRALAAAGLNMVRQHVLIVGTVADLAHAAGPAKQAVQSGIDFLKVLRPHVPPATQGEIDKELADLRALRDRVMAHADRTIGSLTD
jgi:hypothetical protein